MRALSPQHTVALTLLVHVVLPLTLILGVSCSSSTEQVTYITHITGTVTDSIAGLPLSGYTVQLRNDSAVTDNLGRFGFVESAHADTLTVPSVWFEPYQVALSGQRDTALQVRLNRLVAYVKDFALGPNGRISATIVNVRGANRVAQDNTSWVIYYSPSIIQSSAIPSNQWTWQAVDASTWRVSVVTGDALVTGAQWNIADISGGGMTAQCTVGQTLCTDNVH
jgi:hypothetical protein